MEKEIVWQPTLKSNYGLEINLDKEFAKELVVKNIGSDRQRGLNNLGKIYLKEHGINRLSPFSFHEDTLFLYQIRIDTNRAISTDHQNATKLLNDDPDLKTILYYSHNVHDAHNTYVLQHLFAKYIESAKNIMEREL